MRDYKIERDIRGVWRPRPRRASKNNFGRIFILAGSQGLTGAATLTSFAALRAGAGLVTLGCPERVYSILARRRPEVMVHPFPSTHEGGLSERGFSEIIRFSKTQDVLAVGPGLGRHSSTQKLVRRIFESVEVPLVVDADGINAFKGHVEILRKCREIPIFTPHAGEFLRVFGGKKPVSDEERKKRTVETARKFRVVLVLKGYHTVIAAPNGKVALNPTGNPGMATGGTGDVLTGIIAALSGQGMSAFDAARFGAYLHGLAGDLAVREKGEISLVAGDLIDFFPRAVKLVLK